jgi:hypothetical protein
MKLFIFFTVFYFLHRFHFFIYFFSLVFSVKKAFQKTKTLNHTFYEIISLGFNCNSTGWLHSMPFNRK